MNVTIYVDGSPCMCSVGTMNERLRAMAGSDRHFVWYRKDLSTVASSGFGRLIWNICCCLRSFVYGTDIRQTRYNLLQVRRQLDGNSSLVRIAIRNFNGEFPHHAIRNDDLPSDVPPVTVSVPFRVRMAYVGGRMWSGMRYMGRGAANGMRWMFTSSYPRTDYIERRAPIVPSVTVAGQGHVPSMTHIQTNERPYRSMMDGVPRMRQNERPFVSQLPGQITVSGQGHVPARSSAPATLSVPSTVTQRQFVAPQPQSQTLPRQNIVVAGQGH